MVTTQVSADIRRKAILIAAREVCEEVGVHAMSTRKVAKKAGLPLSTMQHVFPTLADLLKAVVEDINAEIEGALRTGLAKGDGLAATLRVGLPAFWGQMVAGRRLLQLTLYEATVKALRDEALEGFAEWQYEGYYDLIEVWLREACEDAGEVIAVRFDVLARVLTAAVDGKMLQYVVKPYPEQAARDLAVIIDMLIGVANPRPRE